MWKFCAILLIMVTNCAICSRAEPIIQQQQQQINPSPLYNDLCGFLDLVPIDDVRNLTVYFYANDRQMRKSYDYLRTTGKKLIEMTLSRVPTITKFSTLLNESGVDLEALAKKYNRVVLTLDETKAVVVNDSSSSSSNGSLGGIDAFFKETLLLIPQDEFMMLLMSKMESDALSSFVEKLSSSDYNKLADNLANSQDIQMLYFNLKSQGIDILEWVKQLRGFFGM